MPIAIKTKKPLPPRYPVQVWLGKYQAYRLTMHRGRYWRDMCKCLEMFFKLNPGLTGLEMFTSANVLDYFVWRRQTCMLSTILKEIKHVKAMWIWCIEQHNLPLLNPIKPRVLAALKARTISVPPTVGVTLSTQNNPELLTPFKPVVRDRAHYGMFTFGIF